MIKGCSKDEILRAISKERTDFSGLIFFGKDKTAKICREKEFLEFRTQHHFSLSIASKNQSTFPF